MSNKNPSLLFSFDPQDIDEDSENVLFDSWSLLAEHFVKLVLDDNVCLKARTEDLLAPVV